MNKKKYTAPEAEIEKFNVVVDVFTASYDDGLDDSNNEGNLF